MRRGVLFAVLVGVLSIALSGCWNPFKPDDGNGNGNGGVGDRKTPKRLLEFFARAYMDKSIERYEESLDEEYTFTFMKKDYGAAGVDSIHPYWGLTEDIERTTSMFTSPTTLNISFNFNLAVMDWYECEDVITVGGEQRVIDAACSIWKPDIQVTIDEGGAEPTTYWVNASWISLTIMQDRYDPTQWTILRIEESPEPP